MAQIDTDQIESASLSDVGRMRRANEDACAEFSQPSGRRLFVVADGMGGHRGGGTASRLAVETIGDLFAGSNAAPEKILREALETANRRIHETARENLDLSRMGTTGVAFLVDGSGRGWVAHVGDSRLYRLRSEKMEVMTSDHSLVGELERGGLLTAAEAAVHPRRNELLRSIGVEPVVEVEVRRLAVAPGDRFLLCSDGLWSLVSDSEIGQVLARERPTEAARVLVELANDRGGTDNATVQVVKIPGDLPPDFSGTDDPPMPSRAGKRRRWFPRLFGFVHPTSE
jgi:protein phosphatase